MRGLLIALAREILDLAVDYTAQRRSRGDTAAELRRIVREADLALGGIADGSPIPADTLAEFRRRVASRALPRE